MKLKRIKIASLCLDEANVIDHQADDVQATARSLVTFGQQKPIVVSQDNWVAAGNGTVLAASSLGWVEIMANVSDLDENQLRAYSIADNKTGRKAAWDEDNLAERLEEIAADDLALLEATAFDSDELEGLLDDWEEPVDWGADLPQHVEPEEVPDVEPQVDRAEELRAEWGTETGQLWTIGKHRLLCGDSTCAADVERLMGGEKAGLVLTDPPYGISEDGGAQRTRGSKRKNGPAMGWDAERPSRDVFDMIRATSCSQVIWGGNYFSDFLPVSRGWLYWEKLMGGDFSDGELAWTSRDGVLKQFTKAKQTADRLHTTQKPVELFVWCINLMPKTDTIFDPFLGSGTTMLAAHQLGRVCYGIEISPAYVAVTLQRMKDAGLNPQLERQPDGTRHDGTD